MTNLVIKGPVITTHDQEIETAIFDIFNKIGHINGEIAQQGQTKNRKWNFRN
ncbi:hypothetical protein P344_06475 [Spiroplasma mirum ATCC 29335]|uniref:Uncharacterized protein n=1 Tax=Spiroplasma mirum ATCC 29335 TaxID=838561 RepID=W6AMQ1_9MOLU|nr:MULTISPECIES: hypothetical protein [Spiroplasma]AHI58598.1 hypothetical protein P344_06475 [Spiroplasma mirum ATCC 29335]AKM53502.1 hypothetical protein SATRI_v1c11550 [Spiroplasma atrichopogonis]